MQTKEMDKGYSEKMYDYWLCSIPAIGNASIRRLLELCGSAREVYETDESILAQALKKNQLELLLESRSSGGLEASYEQLEKQGIHFATVGEEEYPLRLGDIPDAPYGIFWRGRLPADEELSVAIIGARDCSEYGRYVAKELGSCMGRQGIQVISGMARGIDGISQVAALEAGGTSYGVLGSGVDICYPSQNRPLYDQLMVKGGILSAYPPGTLPRPQNFPPRNRIVSGLADAVVVIEAREKSGTLITVDMALEQGREVYVVPGRITDRLSDGCNRLLEQGASLILSPDRFAAEIIDRFRDQKPELCEEAKRRRALLLENRKARQIREDQIATVEQLYPDLPPDLLTVYHELDYTPQTIPQIQHRLLPTPYPIPQLTALLMRLTLTGHATQPTPGRFAKKG